ncbi:MAG: folate-binding protein YgfZ [Pseudomonas sp.]|uniref:CAF17-like 4Fe-4S cluster assembly/insertion protein YgfZ n=1 Tax=Pseudomonas sp. TaxID=306 RepID=UPI003399B861
MADSAFFSSLSHEGLLAVRGADASTFLQGQLTCNLKYLNETTASLGARCTPKGRMLSSFRIVGDADGFLLAMDRELVPRQLADLNKYAVFSKSKLSDASDQWTRFGLFDADASLLDLGLTLASEANAVARHDGLLAIRLDARRSELWVPSQSASGIETRLQATLRQAPLNEWLLVQVRAGIGQVFAATYELFIPQMLNLQAVGAVSFKKGCYTGQEIVARMQYLGKLKRRLYRLALHDTALPEPGTELFSPVHGSSIGEVVLAALTDDGVELLAVLQADAVADARIHLSSGDGPTLQLLDLPYTLDRDREIQH